MKHRRAVSGIHECIRVAKLRVSCPEESPPTINLENPDPDCDLDYTPNTARQTRVRTALKPSLGFGGHNVCLAFKAV